MQLSVYTLGPTTVLVKKQTERRLALLLCICIASECVQMGNIMPTAHTKGCTNATETSTSALFLA